MVRDLSRRRFLWLAAGLPVVAACSDGDSSSAPSATAADTTAASRASTSTTASLPEGATSTTAADGTAPDATDGNTPADVVPEVSAADFAALGACRLYPRSTAGPYPLDEQFDRRDITEGYPGHPVLLGLRVVDTTCEPVPGAAVEIWHTDHTGDYSAFRDGGDGKNEAAGTTFMRGTQVADEDGIVRFDTIYPGWYPGRAVHIAKNFAVQYHQRYPNLTLDFTEFAEDQNSGTSLFCDNIAFDLTVDMQAAGKHQVTVDFGSLADQSIDTR